MERLSEYAIELNEIEILNNCSYSCYMNMDNVLHKLRQYEDLGYSPEDLKARLELADRYEDLCK